MLIQVIVLVYNDGEHTTYVDEVGTEDAAESFRLFEEHVYDDDGIDGTVKFVHIDNDFKSSRIVER
jgi:hypothetical protein